MINELVDIFMSIAFSILEKYSTWLNCFPTKKLSYRFNVKPVIN